MSQSRVIYQVQGLGTSGSASQWPGARAQASQRWWSDSSPGDSSENIIIRVSKLRDDNRTLTETNIFVKATLYYKTIDVGDYRIPLEVFDTDRTVINLVTGEILLVVFSITDRSSLLVARSILDRLERADGDNSRVLLLGNKMDLDHLREVRK